MSFVVCQVGRREGLESCFEGLVIWGNYAWCFVIVVIFMGFGRAEAKRCDGWQSKTQGGAGGWGGKGFLWGRVGESHYVIVLCWNCILRL